MAQLCDAHGHFIASKEPALTQKALYSRTIRAEKKSVLTDMKSESIKRNYSVFYQRMANKHPNLTPHQIKNAISNYKAKETAYKAGLRKTEPVLEYSPPDGGMK